MSPNFKKPPTNKNKKHSNEDLDQDDEPQSTGIKLDEAFVKFNILVAEGDVMVLFKFAFIFLVSSRSVRGCDSIVYSRY